MTRHGLGVRRTSATLDARRMRRWFALVTPFAALAFTAGTVMAADFGAWGAPVAIEDIAGNSHQLNTASSDGCPIQSPDGLSLFMASNRPGGLGGLDIWIAQRDSTSEPFGDPVNPGAPVNSTVDDFCPTPIRGDRLFFVSRRTLNGA